MYDATGCSVLQYIYKIYSGKHMALHQIHKIMLFLASSYDPFNIFNIQIKTVCAVKNTVHFSIWQLFFVGQRYCEQQVKGSINTVVI